MVFIEYDVCKDYCQGAFENKTKLNHNIYILLILVFQVSSVFSQQPENTRNLSKYATNHVVDSAVYQNLQPHETVKVTPPSGKNVKNVILIIGDGMGLSHISSAWVANKGKLNLDNFPVVGLARTYSHNRLITDSGAAGTAIATGQKTNNYVVGVDSLGKPLTTLVDYAQKAGMKTGISVVCRLNDATPAAFVAHQTDRDQAEDIVSQFPESKVDFIAGGGMKYWRNRTDNKDMVQLMKRQGYQFAENEAELSSLSNLPALAILADLELPVAAVRANLFRIMNGKAIELLNSENKNGFFLMIEGSCIDDWSHANKIDKVIDEILDLDRTIGDVLQWAEKDGETLVVVTADHETGGLTLLDGEIKTATVKVDFANTSHSNVLVPVFAFGPGAENFAGIYENAELGRKIIDLIQK